MDDLDYTRAVHAAGCISTPIINSKTLRPHSFIMYTIMHSHSFIRHLATFTHSSLGHQLSTLIIVLSRTTLIQASPRRRLYHRCIGLHHSVALYGRHSHPCRVLRCCIPPSLLLSLPFQEEKGKSCNSVSNCRTVHVLYLLCDFRLRILCTIALFSIVLFYLFCIYRIDLKIKSLKSYF